MNANDRFKEVVLYLKGQKAIKTQKELGYNLGFETESAFSQVVNGKVPMSKTLYSKIKTLYPFINVEWIENGIGQMLLYKQQEIIQSSKVYDDPVIPYSGDVLAEVVGGDGVYYPNVVASGGFDFATLNVETERMSVNVPQFEKGLIYINVYGDSMSPRYNSGDVIGIKQIEPDFILYGYPYVVVLTNGDVHIKIIKKGKGEDSILLVSENEYYEPKEFRLELFKQFFVVKGVIKKEMM